MWPRREQLPCNPASIRTPLTGPVLWERRKDQVFPDWVETGKDGMKRLSIRGFEALTVEALRELRAEKDRELRERDERIASVERRLAGLEAILKGTTRP